jgi:hypothetical protein
MYLQRTYFHQGYDLFLSMESYMNNLSAQLQQVHSTIHSFNQSHIYTYIHTQHTQHTQTHSLIDILSYSRVLILTLIQFFGFFCMNSLLTFHFSHYSIENNSKKNKSDSQQTNFVSLRSLKPLIKFILILISHSHSFSLLSHLFDG